MLQTVLKFLYSENFLHKLLHLLIGLEKYLSRTLRNDVHRVVGIIGAIIAVMFLVIRAYMNRFDIVAYHLSLTLLGRLGLQSHRLLVIHTTLTLFSSDQLQYGALVSLEKFEIILSKLIL